MKRVNFYTLGILFTTIFLLNAASVTAQQQTINYQCLGLPQFFSVPAGVTQIRTEVIGGSGDGDSTRVNVNSNARGGKGAKITATLTVTPGQLLRIEVACRQAASGFPLGGNQSGFSGSAGGAGSAIFLNNDNTVLIVAGGGGGAGTDGFFDGTTKGGDGGDAIAATGNGSDGQGLINPGRGGAFAAAGTPQGGDSATGKRGGGGGGGYDGMGGGGGQGGTTSGSNGSIAGSGGGGGGKSYLNALFSPLNVSAGLGDSEADGSISISYTGQAAGFSLYRCSGSAQTYTVPNGVRTLMVTGIGGDGGSALGNRTASGSNDNFDDSGGSGIAAGKSANINVTPGEQLSLAVGCKGAEPYQGSALSDLVNYGGAGGFGFFRGGKGGDGDRPILTAGANGAVGGGGATGIGRGASPIFVAAGGGGGGGFGGIIGCNPGFGGAADGYNGTDAAPCANKGIGGVTGGGGALDGGNGCSYCSSGGGGGAGGGYPSGTSGTAGGIGEAGGGGGGGGKSYAVGGTRNFQSVDTDVYRTVLLGALFNRTGLKAPANGVLIITPLFNSLTPPIVTPKLIPAVPTGSNGWYRSDVNVSWQIDSSGAPLLSQTGCASTILNTDNAGVTYTCSAANAFGTTSASTPLIKRDVTMPNITATAVKFDGTTYVFGTTTNQSVTVTYNCTDATSGVDVCPSPQTYGNSASVTARASDQAGNVRTVDFGNIVNNNQPPTITPIADVNLPINGSTQPNIQFTVGDDTTPPQNLVVTASSSNPALVPNDGSSISIASQPNANRDIYIRPANNKVGTTIITVTVRDAGGATAQRQFIVSVNCGSIQVGRFGNDSVPFGANYSDTLFATGGVAPYTFRLRNGTLPNGLEISDDNTTINGIPTKLGAFTLTYDVTDSAGCRIVAPVTTTVSCLTNYTVLEAQENAFGSLRFAVTGACPNSIIDFNPGISQVDIIGKLNVNQLTIRGPGADKLTVRNVAPNGVNNPVFQTSGNSEISGLTMTGGNSPTSFGGGIRQDNGTLSVKDSVIDNNYAAYGGGGIFSEAGTTLNVLNSTISNNVGSDNQIQGSNGGGIKSRGTVNIINSTISGNTAEGSNSAGGIYAPAGLISNSTITNNLISSTSNPVNSAGGVYGGATPNRLTVRSSIIAANQNNAQFPDIFNLFTSSGYNLIGNRGSVTAFNQTGDRTGTSSALFNPLLDVLRLNGGTTPTHAFLSMLSPAIDQGNSFGLTNDQRGSTRPIDIQNILNAAGGDGADIGAYEMPLRPTAAGVSISGRVLVGQRGLINATVYLTDQNGATRAARTSFFGYFHFEDVEAGQTYIISVISRRHQFRSQVVSTAGNLSDLNFIADF